MQSGAYQNSTFVVGVAKAGLEEGCDLAGGSCVIAPSGEIVAQSFSKADELIVARCDLDLALENKRGVLNFANREPEYYKLITERRNSSGARLTARAWCGRSHGFALHGNDRRRGREGRHPRRLIRVSLHAAAARNLPRRCARSGPVLMRTCF